VLSILKVQMGRLKQKVESIKSQIRQRLFDIEITSIYQKSGIHKGKHIQDLVVGLQFFANQADIFIYFGVQ
jgi:hypothetical protein